MRNEPVRSMNERGAAERRSETMRLLRRVRLGSDERGIALVLALGIMVVLGLSVATLVEYTASSSRSASHSGAKNAAYSQAEAGLNDVYGILSKQGNNPFSSTLLPSCGSPTTVAHDNGWATFCGNLPAGSDTWTVTTTGKLRNPSVPGGYSFRTLTAQIKIKPNIQQPLVNQVWNYMFATNTNGTGACDETLNSGSNVTSNIYVFGNLCMSNDAHITGANTKVVAKGYLKMANTSDNIGTSAVPVAEAHIVGSCTVAATTHNPCRQGAATAGDQIWAGVLDTTPPVVNPPTVEWDLYYNNANPGPKYACYTVSGTPPTFDNNTVRNSSVTPSQDLTPLSSSYTCRTAAGELSWNSSTKVLTVSGAIFIDGPVKVTCAVCRYTGKGTLYVSGSFILPSASTPKFCGKLNAGSTDCDWTGWDPNATSFLAIIANGSTADQAGVSAGQSVVLASGTHFQGGLYGSQQVVLGSGVAFQGPVVASSIGINGGITTYPFNLTSVPSSVPDQPTNFGEPQPPQYQNG